MWAHSLIGHPHVLLTYDMLDSSIPSYRALPLSFSRRHAINQLLNKSDEGIFIGPHGLLVLPM